VGTERHSSLQEKCCGSCLRCAMKDSEADRKILNSRVIDGNKVKCNRKIPASLHSIMPNDAASISMCSDRISKHHTDCTPDNDNIPKSAIVQIESTLG
jgi:hypothetical protein